MAVIVFALCAAPLALLLNRTPFGIAIYMIGSNERSMRFSGVDTRRVLLRVYVLSSLLCGVAALVMMSRFNSANAAYGESYQLITILAAVLGGVDPFGGFGRVMGLMLALIILQVISSGLNLLGLAPSHAGDLGCHPHPGDGGGLSQCAARRSRPLASTTTNGGTDRSQASQHSPRRRRQPGPAASRTASRADLSYADRESRMAKRAITDALLMPRRIVVRDAIVRPSATRRGVLANKIGHDAYQRT